MGKVNLASLKVAIFKEFWSNNGIYVTNNNIWAKGECKKGRGIKYKREGLDPSAQNGISSGIA